MKSERIVIRSTNWLGDAVMTTPAIGAIRHAFPAAKITLLANPLVSQLFSPHEWVDEVMTYDRKGRHAGIGGKFRMAAELRERGFDTAILLQNAFDAALLAWLAGVPRRIGYRTDGRGILLSRGVPLDSRSKQLHHVDYYLAMLARVGIETDKKNLRLVTRKEEDNSARVLLEKKGIRNGDFVIGINPGASYGSAKRWYPEQFAAVGEVLRHRWNAKLVVTGGPGEETMAAEIEAGLYGACANLAGKTSVRELMALIKRCNFFITNDSGPMHIAAAFGIPLVAIFGPTDHTTTSPYSDRAAVVSKDTSCAPCLKRECPVDHRCMADVTAEDVLVAAQELRDRLEWERRVISA